VIVSGGLSSDENALHAFEESGATSVMLARGALGNPWLFGRLLGTYEGEPTPEEVVEELDWVITCAEEHLGVERAGRYLRKFYPWYAERLELTRREREPLVTPPTTAAARTVWRRAARSQPQIRTGIRLGARVDRCYTARLPPEEVTPFSWHERQSSHLKALKS
jgi:tRNA-dihydrouridine synthase